MCIRDSYGDSVEAPSVVGMTKNDAVTTFGKFLNVEVKEEYTGSDSQRIGGGLRHRI